MGLVLLGLPKFAFIFLHIGVVFGSAGKLDVVGHGKSAAPQPAAFYDHLNVGKIGFLGVVQKDQVERSRAKPVFALERVGCHASITERANDHCNAVRNARVFMDAAGNVGIVGVEFDGVDLSMRGGHGHSN